MLDMLIEQNRMGDVSLLHDQIICIGPIGRPVGCLVWRPSALIHEFRMKKCLISRPLAIRMIDFAIAHCKSGKFPVREAIFNTTSDPMLRLAEDFGATEQPGQLYTVKL